MSSKWGSRFCSTLEVLLPFIPTAGVPAGVPITLLYPESSLRNDTLRGGILVSLRAVLFSLLIGRPFLFNCSEFKQIRLLTPVIFKESRMSWDHLLASRGITHCLLYSREHIATEWFSSYPCGYNKSRNRLKEILRIKIENPKCTRQGIIVNKCVSI